MDLALSFLGVILSGLGAIIALWQARKAKKYRDEIIQDRTKILLIDTIGIARKARDECRKIITQVGKPVRGVDQQEVINTIRDCLEKVMDNSHKFELEDISESIKSLDDNIAHYSREADKSKRFQLGDNIYVDLGEIIRQLSQEIDNKL